MSDLLFELGCEELPSHAVSTLAEALREKLQALLSKALLSHGEVSTFATPRRLAVLICDLQKEKPSQTITRRGPALAQAYDAMGKPTQALVGFAKSCNASLEQLVISKTEKGEWLTYESTTEGEKTATLLPQLINQALAALPVVKPMRWGLGDVEFARPVHWAILLFGEELIDCEVLGVKTDRLSYGHRFHYPQAVVIDKAQNYEALLHEAYVIADFSKRKQLIIQKVQELAKSKQARALMPDALIDEVTSIVEWPEALIAHFDEAFLAVPPEALIASMQVHQKSFALQDENKKLLPYFITVANIRSKNPQQVIAGNEKVMRARLSDAAFFFEQDKKQSLVDHIPQTAKVIFQARLGSLQDKALRLQALMIFLATEMKLNEEQASRAALLSKCDLLTGMVGEFPELQGLMGYYYALHDGEDLPVARALHEQYLPRFAADQLPQSELGLALSLAERLDTLVGIFAIGGKPSGVKDPFKLRRHALAVARILLELPTPLKLSALIAETLIIYGDNLAGGEALVAELKPFILERLQSYTQGLGFPLDLTQAVLARQDEWLYDFKKRLLALQDFVKLPEAVALSAACKRVNNILAQAKFSMSGEFLVDEHLLTEKAEKTVFTQVVAMEQTLKSLYAEKEYAKLLNELASLRESVDAFFDEVMVMVENQAIKANRLNLLARLQTLLQGVADISLLQL